MTAIYLMLPVSLLLALIFLIAYVWSVRSGQYEDTDTPAMRILTEEAGHATRPPSAHQSLLNNP
ncbi:MAG: cbb3-type cytochrome oxidase assembly protein CcoS [Verrucomicrobia bacterium]|jgi:cbb3-type cytochrome oxidase maturation protein|nr:cbb3-type cytochrome oxidase assembly protein CcoS [Verrucomicrobiota bacterium]